jgi:hypothetical protein
MNAGLRLDRDVNPGQTHVRYETSRAREMVAYSSYTVTV